jgi:inosine/xanthosine triphosphatase
MKVVVGTTNPAKLSCVRQVVAQVFPATEHEIVGVQVPSGVSDQPFSVDETRAGSYGRAKAALAEVPDADYAVGLEGGVEVIGEQFFECGWMCVIRGDTGRVGWGSSARFELSRKIVDQLRQGKELAEVMTALSGVEEVGKKQGAMGILTNDNLDRKSAYSHGLIFAFAPFLSDPQRYWD